MPIWNQFRSILFGGAIGAAARTAIEPQIEPARQLAWSNNPNRVLAIGTIAELLARGLIDDAIAQDWALRDGFDADKLEALSQLALGVPDRGALGEMLNRDTVDRDAFNHALAKLSIEPRYWDALFDLTRDKLSAETIANAIQQGHLPNPGILPDVSPAVTPAVGQVVPDAPDGQPPSHVPLTTIDISPLEELKASGLNAEQLQVLANLSGLPPGPEALLTMWNRQLIDEPSVDAGIREGHMKTKWTGPFKRLRWAVLSAQDYASAHLRQWVTQQEMYDGGALTGHTKAQMDLLFLNRGRPASPTQMWRAWARGAVGPRGVPAAFEDHAKAIAISDIRPEYAELLWEIRFNYPPLFQLNRLVASGAIDADTAAEWAHKALVAPEVVEALHRMWSAPTAGAGAKFADRARTQAWATVHTSYVTDEISDVETESALGLLGVPAGEIATVVGFWNLERALTRKRLTPAQVKAAFKKSLYPRDVAITELVDRGYSGSDAATYLDS
jgi:hypothetical protein